jgi:hypothetical protein
MPKLKTNTFKNLLIVLLRALIGQDFASLKQIQVYTLAWCGRIGMRSATDIINKMFCLLPAMN